MTYTKKQLLEDMETIQQENEKHVAHTITIPVDTKPVVLRYEIGHPNTELKAKTGRRVWIDWRDDNAWAVCCGSQCADADGNLEYEPMPSNRTDEWRARFRHDFDTANKIAQKLWTTIMEELQK